MKWNSAQGWMFQCVLLTTISAGGDGHELKVFPAPVQTKVWENSPGSDRNGVGGGFQGRILPGWDEPWGGELMDPQFLTNGTRKIWHKTRAENSEREQRRWSPPAFDTELILSYLLLPELWELFLLMSYLWFFLWEDEKILPRLPEVSQEQVFPRTGTVCFSSQTSKAPSLHQQLKINQLTLHSQEQPGRNGRNFQNISESLNSIQAPKRFSFWKK